MTDFLVIIRLETRQNIVKRPKCDRYSEARLKPHVSNISSIHPLRFHQFFPNASQQKSTRNVKSTRVVELRNNLQAHTPALIVQADNSIKDIVTENRCTMKGGGGDKTV
jgi:hypothetical protein